MASNNPDTIELSGLKLPRKPEPLSCSVARYIADQAPYVAERTFNREHAVESLTLELPRKIGASKKKDRMRTRSSGISSSIRGDLDEIKTASSELLIPRAQRVKSRDSNDILSGKKRHFSSSSRSAAHGNRSHAQQLEVPKPFKGEPSVVEKANSDKVEEDHRARLDARKTKRRNKAAITKPELEIKRKEKETKQTKRKETLKENQSEEGDWHAVMTNSTRVSSHLAKSFQPSNVNGRLIIPKRNQGMFAKGIASRRVLSAPLRSGHNATFDEFEFLNQRAHRSSNLSKIKTTSSDPENLNPSPSTPNRLSISRLKDDMTMPKNPERMKLVTTAHVDLTSRQKEKQTIVADLDTETDNINCTGKKRSQFSKKSDTDNENCSSHEVVVAQTGNYNWSKPQTFDRQIETQPVIDDEQSASISWSQSSCAQELQVTALTSESKHAFANSSRGFATKDSDAHSNPSQNQQSAFPAEGVILPGGPDPQKSYHIKDDNLSSVASITDPAIYDSEYEYLGDGESIAGKEYGHSLWPQPRRNIARDESDAHDGQLALELGFSWKRY